MKVHVSIMVFGHSKKILYIVLFSGLTGVWFFTLATGRPRLQTVYSNTSYIHIIYTLYILLEAEFDIKYHMVDFLRWRWMWSKPLSKRWIVPGSVWGFYLLLPCRLHWQNVPNRWTRAQFHFILFIENV